MDMFKIDRRVRRQQKASDTGFASDLVRLGLQIQLQTGTVTAIEYLKSNGFSQGVIQRVLSRKAIRVEDHPSGAP